MSAKSLEKAIKVVVGLSLFIPLLVFPSSYIFPFIVPKIVYFRSLSLVALGCYILLLIIDWKKYRVKFTPINTSIVLFLLSFFISTFVGVDWYRSFWDNHERMLGLFTVSHFVVYYLILSSVIKDRKDWDWLLRIFLFSGGLTMLIGFWQKFIDPQMLFNNGSGRVSSTLGNSIYYSGYGLFLFLTGLLLYFKEKDLFWKVYALLGGFLGFAGVFFGGTRGTLVGMFFSVFFILLCLSVFYKENKKARYFSVVFLSVILVIFSVLFAYRKTSFVENLPGIGRLVNLTIQGDTSGTRLMAWGIAVDAWKEKPIFGWGPNNYFYAFNKYYRAEFLEYGWGETWFDNAHNIVLNTLSTQGAFGILIYFSIFITGFFTLWVGYRKKDLNLCVLAVGMAFLFGHFVHNIFVFENPTSYLYFFFFLAFINSYYRPKDEMCVSNSAGIHKKNMFGTSVVVFFCVLSIIYFTNVNPARANQASLAAIKEVYFKPELALDLYKEAAKIHSPHIDDIRNDFARAFSQNLDKMFGENKKDLVEKYFDLCFSDMEKNRQLHPLDLRVHLLQAELASLGAMIKNDEKYIVTAEEILADALQKSPRRQLTQYMQAGIKLKLGKTQEAIDLIRNSVENDLKIAEGWIRLSAIFYDLREYDKAKEILTEAKDRQVVFPTEMEQKINLIMSSVE